MTPESRTEQMVRNITGNMFFSPGDTRWLSDLILVNLREAIAEAIEKLHEETLEHITDDWTRVLREDAENP